MNYLFRKQEIDDITEHKKNECKKELLSLKEELLINNSIDSIENMLIRKYTLDTLKVTPSDLYCLDIEDKIIDLASLGPDPRRSIRDTSKPIPAAGSLLTFLLPFEGDSSLFNYCPTSLRLNNIPPFGVIRDNCIAMEFHFPADIGEEGVESAQKEATSNSERIKKYAADLNEKITSFNHSITQQIKNGIINKQEKLKKDQALKKILTVPIKIQQKPSMSSVENKIKLNPSIISPKLVDSVTNTSKNPNYVLEEQHYEQILKILKNMSNVFQSTPKVFENLGEEYLRTYFLVSLNGIYEGNATGETFNFEGKTDIMVKVEGKTIFIAECKFWTGEEGFTKTIDQLLSYLSWADNKTSIIIFNRNKNFSNVLAQIEPTVLKHPNYLRKGKTTNSPTEFRYVFKNKDDNYKEILVSVLCFDVPSSK